MSNSLCMIGSLLSLPSILFRNGGVLGPRPDQSPIVVLFTLKVSLHPGDVHDCQAMNC